MNHAFLCLMAFVFSATAQADPGSRSLSSIKELINTERQLLLQSEIKKRGILGTLYEINRNIHKIQSDIDAVENQLGSARKGIEGCAQAIVQLEKIRVGQKNLLKERLRALYKIGLQGYAQILLSSQTGAEFARNMKFLKIVAERDNRLIENYKVDLDLLAAEQKKLHSRVKVFLVFKRNLTEDMRKVAEQRQDQLYLLSQIENDRDSHLQAIKEWRDASKKLEEKLVKLGLETRLSADLARGSFFEQFGILKPPVSGTIVQKYGMIRNLKFNTKIFHKGLFFGAHPGEKVYALFFGKVAFAGWIDGYGETVIIDHGDHYYSLYAHNEDLKKKLGDNVASGEVIALVGDTGSLRGPGLYVEIRHFSESLDPLPWLDLRPATRLSLGDWGNHQ